MFKVVSPVIEIEGLEGKRFYKISFRRNGLVSVMMHVKTSLSAKKKDIKEYLSITDNYSYISALKPNQDIYLQSKHDWEANFGSLQYFNITRRGHPAIHRDGDLNRNVKSSGDNVYTCQYSGNSYPKSLSKTFYLKDRNKGGDLVEHSLSFTAHENSIFSLKRCNRDWPIYYKKGFLSCRYIKGTDILLHIRNKGRDIEINKYKNRSVVWEISTDDLKLMSIKYYEIPSDLSCLIYYKYSKEVDQLRIGGGLRDVQTNIYYRAYPDYFHIDILQDSAFNIISKDFTGDVMDIKDKKALKAYLRYMV